MILTYLTCRKCGANCEVPAHGSIGDSKKASPGWDCIWDISNGLSPAWYCGGCVSVLKAVLMALKDALGDLKLHHANFAGMTK